MNEILKGVLEKVRDDASDCYQDGGEVACKECATLRLSGITSCAEIEDACKEALAEPDYKKAFESVCECILLVERQRDQSHRFKTDMLGEPADKILLGEVRGLNIAATLVHKAKEKIEGIGAEDYRK